MSRNDAADFTRRLYARVPAHYRAYDADLTRRLLRYVRPYWKRVGIAIALLMGGAAVEMVGPYLTKVAIDRAIPEQDLSLLTTLVLFFLGSLAASGRPRSPRHGNSWRPRG